MTPSIESSKTVFESSEFLSVCISSVVAGEKVSVDFQIEKN